MRAHARLWERACECVRLHSCACIGHQFDACSQKGPFPLHPVLLSWPPEFRKTAPPVFSLWCSQSGLTSINTCQSILPLWERWVVGCVPPHISKSCVFNMLCLVLFYRHTPLKPFLPACLWGGDGSLNPLTQAAFMRLSCISVQL